MIMGLKQHTLRFSSLHEAERWIAQMDHMWVTTGSQVNDGPDGAITATVNFAVEDGHLISADDTTPTD